MANQRLAEAYDWRQDGLYIHSNYPNFISYIPEIQQGSSLLSSLLTNLRQEQKSKEDKILDLLSTDDLNDFNDNSFFLNLDATSIISKMNFPDVKNTTSKTWNTLQEELNKYDQYCATLDNIFQKGSLNMSDASKLKSFSDNSFMNYNGNLNNKYENEAAAILDNVFIDMVDKEIDRTTQVIINGFKSGNFYTSNTSNEELIYELQYRQQDPFTYNNIQLNKTVMTVGEILNNVSVSPHISEDLINGITYIAVNSMYFKQQGDKFGNRHAVEGANNIDVKRLIRTAFAVWYLDNFRQDIVEGIGEDADFVVYEGKFVRISDIFEKMIQSINNGNIVRVQNNLWDGKTGTSSRTLFIQKMQAFSNSGVRSYDILRALPIVKRTAEDLYSSFQNKNVTYRYV